MYRGHGPAFSTTRQGIIGAVENVNRLPPERVRKKNVHPEDRLDSTPDVPESLHRLAIGTADQYLSAAIRDAAVLEMPVHEQQKLDVGGLSRQASRQFVYVTANAASIAAQSTGIKRYAEPGQFAALPNEGQGTYAIVVGRRTESTRSRARYRFPFGRLLLTSVGI